MKQFSMDISVLEDTITKLEQSIYQINALKKKIIRTNGELTGYSWSGKSAKIFIQDTLEWKKNFQQYISNMNKMRNALKKKILPQVVALDCKANAMAGLLGGSVGSSSSAAKVSFDWSSKSEISQLYRTLNSEYESYRKQLSSIQALDGQLCYSGFSIAGQIQSSKREIHEVQQMLRNFKSALDLYQSSVEGLEIAVAAMMEKIEMPSGWSDSVGSLLNNLSIVCGEMDMNKVLKELIDMLKGLNDVCSYGGDPINLATGNFIYHREYLRMKGLCPMEFKIFYNSVEQKQGVLGKGWVHNYQIYIQREKQGVVLHWSDGREEIFVSQEDGQYTHLIGKQDALSETPDGLVYKTTLGVSYVFDKEGRNTKVEDRNGNTLTFSYDIAGRLSEVKSISGEALRYQYDANNLLVEVADNIGRSVNLSYEDGYLTQISDEENHIFQYGYDSNGNMCEITNGRNIQTIRNEYDSQGRVIKQSYPDGGQMQIEYNDNARTLHVTEQNGNKIDYIHDERFRSIETVYADGKIQYAYNDQNQKTQVIDKRGNRTKYDYDKVGNLTLVENPLGEKLEMEYNAMKQTTRIKVCGEEFLRNQYDLRGNLIRRKDALGREIGVSYNKSGKPIAIKQPDGSVISLAYDEHGNISSIREPMGGETHYEYDSLGQVIATVDGNGNRTEYAYNRRGHIIAVTNAEGKTKHFHYNESGKITCIEDYDGSKIQREYNEINKPSKLIDQEGNITMLEYDRMWNMTRKVDANGGETKFIYDKLNRLERVINAKGAEFRYEYDQNGNRTKIMDSDGGVVKLEYDALNRLILVEDADGAVSHIEYNHFGKKTKMIDAMGNVRKVLYDKAGQKSSTIDAKGNETIYHYNSLGKISEVIDPAGRKTTYEYLPGGLLEKVTHADGTFVSYTYDTNRNVKSRTNQEGYTVSYIYDSLNRIARIESSDGQVKSYTYDAVGNVSSVTNANGSITRYYYSSTGKLTKVMDALGNCTEYNYDEMGGLTKVHQYGSEEELSEASKLNESNKNLHLIQYKRDILGHVETVIDALGHEEHYAYDNRGRVIEKQDKDGFSTKYGYTKGGQLAEIQYADGNSVKLSYNPLKQLVEINDWLGVTTIEVDELGRPEKITDQKGREVTYTRGDLGQRLSMEYPGGKVVEYGYDDWMRLTSLKDESGAFQYNYDENGRLKEKIFPNGVRSDYAYSTAGVLASLTYRDEEGILDSYKYQYDAVGNKIGIERQRRDLPEESGSYRYEYDALNRLLSVEKDGVSLRNYGYDIFGNRSFLRTEDTRIDYYYNESNQLMRSVSGESTTDYSYDARGNLIQIMENETLKNTYEYSCMNRMTRANNDTGKMSVYTYNGLGQRTEQQMFEEVSGVNNPVRTIEYVLDQTRRYHNLLQQVEGNDVREFLWDNSVTAENGKNGVHYYTQDELGSPMRYMQTDGTIVQSYSFDEFGNEVLKDQEQVQPFGYTGFYTDKTAGTYFAQAREYMPKTGRFTANDIVKGIKAAPYTLNEYVYCWNRPLTFIDQDGAFPIIWEINESLREAGDEIGDWVGDTVNSVGDVLSEGATTFFNGADYIWENYVPGEIQDALTIGGRVVLGVGREIIEIKSPLGISISDAMAIASVTPIGQAFLDAVCFDRTSDGVYHASQNCWQAPFGYNILYDYVFDGATSMDTQRFVFTTEDGTTYTIWMWKGDYLNLGAGCETGIYFGDDYHVNSALDTNLYMTLNLYDKRTGKLIFTYNPSDPQWWITGFNPKYQDWDDSYLEVMGSIDFSEEPEMWEAFLKEYGKEGGWCFDEENMVAYYQW